MRKEARVGDGTLLRAPKQVKPKNLGVLRARLSRIEEKIEALPGEACHHSGPDRSPLYSQRHDLQAEIQAIEEQGDGGPLLTVTLDAYGSALVRRFLETSPDLEPADVVNGALGFMIGEEDDHYAETEVDAAYQRRTNLEGKGNHIVTIELTPQQYAMVKRVATYDQEPTVAAWIMSETEKSIIVSADCFGERQAEHQAAWDGKEGA